MFWGDTIWLKTAAPEIVSPPNGEQNVSGACTSGGCKSRHLCPNQLKLGGGGGFGREGGFSLVKIHLMGGGEATLEKPPYYHHLPQREQWKG